MVGFYDATNPKQDVKCARHMDGQLEDDLTKLIYKTVALKNTTDQLKLKVVM